MHSDLRSYSQGYSACVADKITPEDTIAVVAGPYPSTAQRPRRLDWARLYPDDRIEFGFVDVDDIVGAARELNARLQDSVVERECKLGLNFIERLYVEAQVKPSWRRLIGGDLAVLTQFSIEIGPRFGFSPYMPMYLPIEYLHDLDNVPHRTLAMMGRLRRASESFRWCLCGSVGSDF